MKRNVTPHRRRDARIRSVAAVLALSFLLSFMPVTGRAGPLEHRASSCEGAAGCVPGQLLVCFRRGTDSSAMREALGASGVSRVLRFIGPPRDRRVALVELAGGVGVEEAARSLMASGSVEFAEPNRVLYPAWVPGEPGFAGQWNLYNTGQEVYGVTGTPGADINVADAWEYERGRTNPVTVAVIDSGVRTGHPELESRGWTNRGEVAGNGLDDDGNGYVDDAGGFNWAGISQTRYYYMSNGSAVETSRPFASGATSRRYIQSITGAGCELTHIGVMLRAVGEPDMEIRVSVKEAGPYSTDRSYFTIAPDEVAAAPTEVYKELPEPVFLAEGATYYIEFKTFVTDEADHYSIYEAQGSHLAWPAYTRGMEFLYDGSAWAANPHDDFYFRTNPNSSTDDDHGHGTFVSSILASARNGQGIAGVNFNACVMPLKASDASGLTTAANAVDAICYAADNGARVINMSFLLDRPSVALQQAVDYAWGKGVVMSAAAGNSGDTTLYYPAACDHVIGVGATNNRDEKAFFSVFNPSIDVVAPGDGVPASGLEGNTYISGGTSAASPHVAGLASLVLSARPGYDPGRVARAVKGYAKDLGAAGRDDRYGCGRIDAGRTMRGVILPYIDSVTPTCGREGVTVTVRGRNFGKARGGSSVMAGWLFIRAYTSWGDTRVTFRLPAGLMGKVQVLLITGRGVSNRGRFFAL